jgi:hypothetical protein
MTYECEEISNRGKDGQAIGGTGKSGPASASLPTETDAVRPAADTFLSSESEK